MTTVVQRIDFCAGHRLFEYDGECECLHGHNYSVELHVSAEQLNDKGMVIDFAEIKKLFGDWIRGNWDHACICHKADTKVLEFLASLPGQRFFTMDGNPSAENMAGHLLNVVGPKLLDGKSVELTRVRLFETAECYAEVSA